MGTRLSSQPLPLSPSAVTLNNTLSLITATITLRNKLVFFQRGMEMGKRRPPYASGLPFSLQHLNVFGDRQTADQFSVQFSTLYNSFSLSFSLCPPLLLLSFFSLCTLWTHQNKEMMYSTCPHCCDNKGSSVLHYADVVLWCWSFHLVSHNTWIDVTGGKKKKEKINMVLIQDTVTLTK